MSQEIVERTLTQDRGMASSAATGQAGSRRAAVDRPNYSIILNQYDDGYILVKCAELKGLVTDGRSMGEALANAVEAVSTYLEADGDASEFNLIITSMRQ